MILNMDHRIISPKTLIEVALPLDAINAAAKEEKAVPRRRHPQTLHYWWARRPLAAARAVIFSQLVHDPEDLWRCQNPGKEPNSQVKGHWTKTRARLFSVIEDLVKWENTTNENVLNKARDEIKRSWRETCELNRNHPLAATLFNPDIVPGLHDPFAGGGTIPLEAQRLGLQASASDLNPVAVLINKALIEIPPRFADNPPVNSATSENNLLLQSEWRAAEGLSEDIAHYGKLVLDHVAKRIQSLYPPIDITEQNASRVETQISSNGNSVVPLMWFWARTVKSPNPAFSHVDVPLISTFVLAKKAGSEVFVEPLVVGDKYSFAVRHGKASESAKSGTSAGKRQGFRCIFSGTPISYSYIRAEGEAGRMGLRLMAIMAESSSGRVYLAPTENQEKCATVEPEWTPSTPISAGMSERVVGYGLTTYADVFTRRQLKMLNAFCNAVTEIRKIVLSDACESGMPDCGTGIEGEGRTATAYADSIAIYLTCAISRLADYNNMMCSWNINGGSVGHLFSRQAIPMSWDFIEINPLANISGNWEGAIGWVSDSVKLLNARPSAVAFQADASANTISPNSFISTDPPYYDNIGYADLSDFFYVWLRRTLKTVLPNLMATITVPKAEELVADPYRHGGKKEAERFFLTGMTSALKKISEKAHPCYPLTIYYAFKQSETSKVEGTSSSGWQTFLEAIIKSGLCVTGTWPMRTERSARTVAMNTNALASSIVLVCRLRDENAEVISRREFIRQLNAALPLALDAMTRESEGVHSPVAPVDLSQAIIGPGMAVFSRYSSVLEADGTPMTVKTALQLINRFLAEDDFDSDTQFCLHWFEQYGWDTGMFGEADTLARAKGTSVDGVKQAGVLHASAGNVRLLKWADYASNWDPKSDSRQPIWEVLHQLIRVFNTVGETGAAAVFAAVQSKAEAARQLAYRLYTLCERKNWAEDARAYNEVVTSWSSIEAAAAKEPSLIQRELFDN
jgi:putative DNA methylase